MFMLSIKSNVTVGLAQMAPYIGRVNDNLAKHMEYIAESHRAGVDLLLFPELSLTGYNLQDLVYEVSLKTALDGDVFKTLFDASRQYDMDLQVGFVDTDSRARSFIGTAYISGGKVLHVHHKVYLCTYTLFDEGRYFAPGDSIRAFDTRFGRAGMLICEDFWHASPPYVLWLDRADLLLMQSASPGRGIGTEDRLDSAGWVRHVNQSYGSLFTNYVIHCNRVGFEDGINFWGGSTIVNPEGDIIAEGPQHEEALIIQTIDMNQLRRTRSRLPLLRDERVGLTSSELLRIVDNNATLANA
jgi:NAD+ synthase (glutamine-hydrolysing)